MSRQLASFVLFCIPLGYDSFYNNSTTNSLDNLHLLKKLAVYVLVANKQVTCKRLSQFVRNL
jgi:hypothetical protein